MVDKIVQTFTPEMTAIVIASFAALTVFTFLIVLITIASLSKAKKRLFIVIKETSELLEKQAAFDQVKQTSNLNGLRLTEVENKIESIERRSDESDGKIAGLAGAADKIESIGRRLQEWGSKMAESQNQLAELKSRVNEHGTLLAQAGQLMGKETADFKQAVQQMRSLEQEFQTFKGFQRTFEWTRDQIVNALRATPVRIPIQNPSTPEQYDLSKKAVIPSEEKRPDTEESDRFRSRYP